MSNLIAQLTIKANEIKSRTPHPSFDSCEEIAWRVSREQFPQASDSQLTCFADRILEAIR